MHIILWNFQTLSRVNYAKIIWKRENKRLRVDTPKTRVRFANRLKRFKLITNVTVFTRAMNRRLLLPRILNEQTVNGILERMDLLPFRLKD